MAGKKIRLIFGLAELWRKLKKFRYDSADYKNFTAEIRLITNSFG